MTQNHQKTWNKNVKKKQKNITWKNMKIKYEKNLIQNVTKNLTWKVMAQMLDGIWKAIKTWFETWYKTWWETRTKTKARQNQSQASRQADNPRTRQAGMKAGQSQAGRSAPRSKARASRVAANRPTPRLRDLTGHCVFPQSCFCRRLLWRRQLGLCFLSDLFYVFFMLKKNP